MIEAPTLELGTTLAGKYKILRVLGAGGMGAVYLAENVAIGRQVAIKVLHARMGRDAATLRRFRQEARATATIGHPGVVDVLDMGETAAGDAFIVMEKLEGQTMGARLKQRHRLSIDETISIVTEALDAIAAAHDKGIVHRDLKPDNLFLVWHPRWSVKVLDFGISRFIDADEIGLTATNTVMGSVLYMPPEQAKDARVAGPPADLYALGAVMYHALSGRPPFGGERYSEVLSRVLTDAPEPIAALRPELRPELAELVIGLLAKKPADRPGPARAIRDRLRAMVDQLTPPAEPAPPADALGATMQPGDAMAATADVSALPLGPTAAASHALGATAAASHALGATAAASHVLGATAAASVQAMPDHDRPIGATTGVAAGEVAVSAPAKRRSWLIPLGASAVLALGAVGYVFGTRTTHEPAVPALDAAIGGDTRAEPPDSLSVIDGAIDGQIALPDGRTARLDASVRPTRRDAGVLGGVVDASRSAKPDAYQPMGLQPEPP
ncbi:MAG TPA: protein kinase [Kofleriaceae bacterium]